MQVKSSGPEHWVYWYTENWELRTDFRRIHWCPLNMPTVSVASTVLNEVDDIDALVESLMRQTLAPAEVIIVDGGSTDGTWERLEAAGQNTRP